MIEADNTEITTSVMTSRTLEQCSNTDADSIKTSDAPTIEQSDAQNANDVSGEITTKESITSRS